MWGKSLRYVGEVFGGVLGCYTPCIYYLPRNVHGPPTWSEWLDGSRGGCGLGWGWCTSREGGREGKARRLEQ